MNVNKLCICGFQKEDVERQEQLLNLYNRLSVDGVDDLDEIDVLPVDWLISWLDNKREVRHQIDNTKLLCRHDRLDPTAVTSAKYVSRDSVITFALLSNAPSSASNVRLSKKI